MSKTIVIAQGACSPIRPKVLTALKPYGYKVGHKFEIESYSLGYDWERGEDGKPIDQDWSKTQANVAEITVSDARASWTEFLICCTGAFQLMSPPIDPRNQIWAQE